MAWVDTATKGMGRAFGSSDRRHAWVASADVGCMIRIGTVGARGLGLLARFARSGWPIQGQRSSTDRDMEHGFDPHNTKRFK